ncbi:hypothetical protein [Streptomyces sp. NPDC001315]|uniref:hypothetical protein n=1 Tax=Streptomyces sp. NPDC001315 TaxID=3364562 RepID=UPI0036A9FD0C
MTTAARASRASDCPAKRREAASLPLVEVTAAGHGRGRSGNRLVGPDLGVRLRHRTHRATRDSDWHTRPG